LLGLQCWSGAYYLAGYAVECGLKACIIKCLMTTDQFPERKFSELRTVLDTRHRTVRFPCRAQDQARRRRRDRPHPVGLLGDRQGLDRDESVCANDKGQGGGALHGHRRQETRGAGMDQIPLVTEQIEAGRTLIERLAANGIPITAATWVKESDSWQWYLYLVTPLVGADGATTSAYRTINTVLRTGPQPPEIDVFQIKAVGPAEPLGQAILNARPQPGKAGVSYGGISLGGVSVDGIYFYPPLVAADP
jgi:hypothetical protein